MIDEKKKELRFRMSAARNAMPAKDREERSRRIAAHILAAWEQGIFAWSAPHAEEAGKRPLRLGIYVPFRSEADVMDVARWCWQRGVPVAAPRVDMNAKTMTLRAVGGEEELVQGAYGIREPGPNAPVVGLEPGTLLIVPGLAFDRTGGRLGYGGGYYDRLLAAHRRETESGAILLAAPAFAFQVIEAVPAAPHDMRVRFLITEDGVIDCRADGRER